MKTKSKSLLPLPPEQGSTREELRHAPPLFPVRTPGFEKTLTLLDDAQTPRGYIGLAEARLIANWLRLHFPNL